MEVQPTHRAMVGWRNGVDGETYETCIEINRQRSNVHRKIAAYSTARSRGYAQFKNTNIPVSDDLNNFKALTPNHFLLGRASPNHPIVMEDSCLWRK